MAGSGEVPIGKLRWLVKIAKRAQTADAGTGITETVGDGVDVHADIQPIGTIAFWGSQQVDTPVTHRIAIRWVGYIDQTYVVLRRTRDADSGVRTETFRIRRIQEIEGRKRFMALDCELEKAT